jgi:DNA-directed RNA polymerase specialized sigma24 family protein
VSRRLGSSSVAALVTAYAAGATTAELAQQFGVSRTAVKDLLHRQHVVVRGPQGLPAEDAPEAARLYESGWLLRQIAEKFGVSQGTVRRKLLARGVVMRSGHGDVRGHVKVPTGGQVEVPGGGQLEVPTPRSSCRA